MRARIRKIFTTVICALLTFITPEITAEGDVYQEGVDTVVPISCTPPTHRTDGTTITHAEMNATRVFVYTDAALANEVYMAIVPSIFCVHNFELSRLPFGQLYKSAMIRDTDGMWSDVQPNARPFEYIAKDAVPIGEQVPRDTWVVTKVDSEELVNWYMPAQHVYDGDLDTLWHSQYQGSEPPHPHFVEIYIGGMYEVSGFQQQPRSNGGNGTVKDYTFELSVDGETWTSMATGTFPAGSALHTVSFEPTEAKYFRFTALSEQDGGPQTAVAELYVQGDRVVRERPGPPVLTN